MTSFLYSNAVGIHLFDEQFKLREQIQFKQAEQYKSISLLSAGEWLPAEKALLKKQGSIIVIGQRSLPLAPLSQDIEKLTAVSAALQKFPPLRAAALNYTRTAIREGFRKDTLLIQAINTIDDLDRIANTMMKRLREWYGYYSPEFSVENSKKFCELILAKPRETLLREIKVAETMGASLEKQDIDEIRKLAEKILDLYALQDRQLQYAGKIMQQICPSVHAIAGTLIGAKLIAIAGGLQNLAEYPASTLQLLGAEKAMFRHLRTGARSPRFGVLAQHILVTRAKEKEKGKIARVLADKLSIAVKVDHFGGKPIGAKFKADLEKRFGKY